MITNLPDPFLLTFVSVHQFHIDLPWLNACLACVFNVKALVGTFNQEKILVGAFFVIVKYQRTFVQPSFEALVVMVIASLSHAATAHSAENQEVRL